MPPHCTACGAHGRGARERLASTHFDGRFAVQEETDETNVEQLYVKALGQHSSAGPIVATIEKCIQQLGEKIWHSAKKLADGSRQEGHAWADLHMETTKFFDAPSSMGSLGGDSKFDTLQIGTIVDFHKGVSVRAA